jgi:hypothetical protein
MLEFHIFLASLDRRKRTYQYLIRQRRKRKWSMGVDGYVTESGRLKEPAGLIVSQQLDIASSGSRDKNAGHEDGKQESR